MLIADANGLRVSDGAQKDDPDQLVLGPRRATVEVGGADHHRILQRHADLFAHLAAQRIFETLALVHPPGDAFPRAGGIILVGRAAQQQVAAIRRGDQRANAAVETPNRR